MSFVKSTALCIVFFCVTVNVSPAICVQFKKCSELQICSTCSDTQLVCNASFGQSVDVFLTLPRSLETIKINFNNFTNKLPRNIFGNCTKSFENRMTALKTLDLSNNNITKLHGKTFHCIDNLETLILSHNDWHVDNHTHVFSSLPSLKRLILENTFYEKINGTAHLFKLARYLGEFDMLELEELDLSGNEFYFMPNETHNALCRLKNLKVLNLSNNLLNSVTLCAEMDNLKVLNLSYNHLNFLGDELMENITRMKNLEKVYLEGNIFQCDCGMRNFYNWLKNDSLSFAVHNKHELVCGYSYNTVDEDSKIMELPLSDLTCRHHSTTYNATGVVVGLIFGILVVFFVLAMYYNRVLVKNTWKRLVQKPVTLSLIPQSQGYATVDNSTIS